MLHWYFTHQVMHKIEERIVGIPSPKESWANIAFRLHCTASSSRNLPQSCVRTNLRRDDLNEPVSSWTPHRA